MTPEILNTLETMTLIDAQTLAIELVEKRKVNTIKQKAAKAQIIRDIQSAPTSGEVMRIMWQQLLASQGLRTSGSTWKKKYDNI